MSQHESYNDVPYRSTTTPECDPLRMSTIAHLFGVPSADPGRCDVLEVGCGDAVNLLSLATVYPGIQGVGFDPAVGAIERGEALRTDAGLDNVTLLTEAEPGALDDSADYVMAHGVLSWVSDEPRQQVIELAARAARPGALVALSYRAFPHAYYQLVSREMALDAIAKEEQAAAASGRELTYEDHARIAVERVRLAALIAGPQSVHGQQMTAEADRMEAQEPWVVFHDDLAESLTPFRVTTVAELCRAHGLQYVGELMPIDLWQVRLAKELRDIVREEAGPNALRRQQMVDDLVNTAFHCSLFVKADEAPQHELSTEGLTIYVGRHPGASAESDARADQVSAPVAQALRDHAPGYLTMEQLAETVGIQAQEVSDLVLRMYLLGVARISTSPPPAPAPAGPHPTASPLVRAEIKAGFQTVSTRFHLSLPYASPIHRAVVSLLDGTRDYAAIQRDFPAAAIAAGVPISPGQTISDVGSVIEAMTNDGLLLPAADA